VAGSYQLGLWARSSGNTTDAPEGNAAAVLAYTVTPLVPIITSLTASPASPRVTGTPLTFSVTVSGGTSPQQCKWLVSTNGWATYTTLRTWAACTTPATWTPTAPWSYQVGVWARSAGNTVDYPEASAALVYDVVPDVRGAYTGSGSATNSGCTDPSDNGSASLSGTLTISSQVGGNISGSLSIVACSSDGCESDMLTLSGTITATGQVSGTLVDAEGSYRYNGTLSGNTLSLTFAGAWRDDIGSCNLSGSFTATRP
jgi:hypothetical protein